MTSSQNFSMAPVSLTCARPFFSTIAPGASPVANISPKTDCAMLLLILPLSTSAASSGMCEGVTLSLPPAECCVSVIFARKIVDDPVSDGFVLGFSRRQSLFSK